MLTTEKKKELIEKFKIHSTDTGSVPVTVALITERIRQLEKHLSKYPKDFSSRRGFLKLIGRRRRLLNYLKNCSSEKYQQIIKELGI